MKRVQMRRGVKLPPSTRYVGRPSRWGNTFRVGREHCSQCRRPMTRSEVVDLYYDAVVIEEIANPEFLEPLRGFDLACYCPLDGQPCHASVLIDLIEASGGPS